VDTPVVSSLRWWQCLAVVLGALVVICSVNSLAVSADQGDHDGAPVVVARMRVNWFASTNDNTSRSSTPNLPPNILAEDNLQASHEIVRPRQVDGRSVLATSCSLRC